MTDTDQLRNHVRRYALGRRQETVALAIIDSMPFPNIDGANLLAMANNIVKALDDVRAS